MHPVSIIAGLFTSIFTGILDRIAKRITETPRSTISSRKVKILVPGIWTTTFYPMIPHSYRPGFDSNSLGCIWLLFGNFFCEHWEKRYRRRSRDLGGGRPFGPQGWVHENVIGQILYYKSRPETPLHRVQFPIERSGDSTRTPPREPPSTAELAASSELSPSQGKKSSTDARGEPSPDRQASSVSSPLGRKPIEGSENLMDEWTRWARISYSLSETSSNVCFFQTNFVLVLVNWNLFLIEYRTYRHCIICKTLLDHLRSEMAVQTDWDGRARVEQAVLKFERGLSAASGSQIPGFGCRWRSLREPSEAPWSCRESWPPQWPPRKGWPPDEWEITRWVMERSVDLSRWSVDREDGWARWTPDPLRQGSGSPRTSLAELRERSLERMVLWHKSGSIWTS